MQSDTDTLADSTSASDVRPYLRRVAASSLINSAVSALATAALLPIVIRQVGMEIYGAWAVLGVFIGIASLLDFGIWKALVYLLPKRAHSEGELFSSALALILGIACLFAVSMWAALIFEVPIFGAAISGKPELAWWLGIGGAAIVFFSLLTNLIRGLMESRLHGHLVNAGYALFTLLLYGVAGAISAAVSDARALIGGSVLVYAALLAVHLFYLRGLRWRLPRAQSMLALTKFGGRTLLADLPSIALGPTVLYLFVLLAENSAQFGVFEIALKISTLAATALGALSTPFFALVASTSDDNQVAMRAVIRKQLVNTAVLAFLGWATFYFLGERILRFVFDATSDGLYRTTLIVLAGSAAAAAMEPIARMQLGLGRLRGLFAVRSIAFSTLIVAIGVLATWPMLDRFAVACAAGFLANAIGLSHLLMREPWGRYLSKSDAPLDRVRNGIGQRTQ